MIHACGPKGEDAKILQDAYTNSLERMLENKLRTIAFPCLATGDFGISYNFSEIPIHDDDANRLM